MPNFVTKLEGTAMKRICTLVYLFFLLFIISCGDGSNSPAPVTGNKWTVMIYLDADNDLSSSGYDDLNEMQEVGSTKNVTVIVQFDTHGETTKRYKVEKGSLTLLEDMGELDMSDPATLQNFVSDSVSAYPADHYALILWDHGQGWKSASRPAVNKSIFNDYDNRNYNSFTPNYYVAIALADAQLKSGAKLDILGIDACEMSVIEAAYEFEFRNVADIYVASQEVVSLDGWDYKDLLTRLVKKPRMTPVELSQAMVESFKNYYANSSYNDQTIAALALNVKYSSDGASDIGTLATAVNGMALRLSALMADSGTRAATLELITNSRSQKVVTPVQEFDDIYVDLVDFSLLIEGDNSPVEQEFNKILLDEYHGPDRPNAHGLSIVFFDRSSPLDDYLYDPSYRNFNPDTKTGSRIAFINEFHWDEMMHTYFSLQYPDKPN
jgi:hypothetical protein